VDAEVITMMTKTAGTWDYPIDSSAVESQLVARFVFFMACSAPFLSQAKSITGP
jgi:hypothetical protein